MIYQGNTVSCQMLADGIAEVRLDNQSESVNKFNRATLGELGEIMAKLKADPAVKGAVLTSAKDVFVVGADITEFIPMFAESDEVLMGWLEQSNAIFFSALEDLPFPTATAINGIALGGGFEAALCTDFRIASTAAKVGLPEVKLGLIPGFGGTIRLPRLIGADNAMEWMATGKDAKPAEALAVGAIDAVVAPEKLLDAAVDVVKQAIAGKLDWQARRAQKTSPLTLDPIEATMAFETAKGFIAGKAGPNYPAPLGGVKLVEKCATLSRDAALKHEHETFIKLAKTPVAKALIGIFLNDQIVKKVAKKASKIAKPVKAAGVLGAGIMGGGIAYVSAGRGVPVKMKDIRPEALELGMTEATKLLTKEVERGRIDAPKMAKAIASISPTLSFDGFDMADVVVEAVVENAGIKAKVLAETEGHLKDGAILASNTSTISITKLAEGLKRPQDFCGMHFFNPVHRMPLVEVIRGAKTSDETIATVVAYASAMGKSPIVVNDCPGFLVNRILFPYFEGFGKLLMDGADFKQVDKVMEKFGWPMGPAYLLDVVGIDTGHHAAAVMHEGFPERMALPKDDPIDVMYQAKRYGQKNGVGFYAYSVDPKGKPKKDADPASYELLAKVCKPKADFSEEEIIDRLMIPMLNETVRCLSEGIVASAAEADMGLIYGIGFPAFRGGALQYLDSIGLENFLAKCEKYAHLSPLYQPLDVVREMAKAGKRFHG
ncbi:MAG: fatty acid oxidation complex subunit alpha FadB [Gammaproteobacteria bacterium]|nr:fatty acid oxidation complex subunit alpha FadB [Gammaproteobacteria bacterium]